MTASLVGSAHSLGIVLVTAGSEAEASALAHHLVEARLAACVNLSPIHSIYRWEGEIQSSPEWQLVIKADLARFEAIAEAIMQHHSYDVPEIIALPMAAGLTLYLDWMAAQTQIPAISE
ncbi:MAG: divalent-cation tolerance protein CutA [Nodosilinea sp.]